MLHLPPHVQHRIDLEKRRAFEAKILRNVTVEDPRAREFTEALQKISPDLFMVKAHDTIHDPDVPLRAGFYHILVRNQDAPMSVMEVHDGGRYAEPDSRIFQVLARGNLRERRVRDRLAREDEREQQEIEKERKDRNEQRKEKLKDIVLSATRASISMNDSVPWTQNAAGRREKK